MIKKFLDWWHSRHCYVIADAADSSITLSRHLFRHMQRSEGADDTKVFVFFIPDTQCYGFMLNPKIDKPTQLANIQYNDKYRCVGFETLCPTVSRIFYDYGITADKCKLSVTPKTNSDGRTYYQIEKPHL